MKVLIFANNTIILTEGGCDGQPAPQQVRAIHFVQIKISYTK
ncbi:hypothetical protein ACI2WT_12240 [Lysinibacillus fusiformis]